ncbi:MAG: hypothetical protein V1779_14995 [bacterium]
MKKNNNDEMAAEYDFSKGERGKHYEKLAEGYTVTVFSPNRKDYDWQISQKARYMKIDKDVNEFFKTSEEINNALRAIIKAIPKTKRKLAQTI